MKKCVVAYRPTVKAFSWQI